MINLRNIREATLIFAVLILAITVRATHADVSNNSPAAYQRIHGSEILSEVVAKSRPSVVKIIVEQSNNRTRGSGVVIGTGKKGSVDILTAVHVIA